jgi:GTP cyclohydrolase I
MKKLSTANGNIPRTEEEKKKIITEAAEHYGKFLEALGFDWKNDENSSNTPTRVAKAWVSDLAEGCFTEPPKVTTFPSTYKGLIFEGNIDIVSMCSHHNLAFTGSCYIGYIPGDRVVGLSKLNRIADWFARRPQIQEGLTQQIHDYLNDVLHENKGVVVMVKAQHTCCSNRGIRHKSVMVTTSVSGYFEENKDGCKDEFYKMVEQL